MLLLQPVADALLVHDAKAVFYAIKEEDSGHFVTLTKRMFTPKFGSHLIAIFVMMLGCHPPSSMHPCRRCWMNAVA